MAWYGKQTPKKFDYHGERVTGTANNQLAPYAIAGISGTCLTPLALPGNSCIASLVHSYFK